MNISLNNPELFVEKAFINGKWVSADNAKTFDVHNPSDNSIIGNVPDMRADETKRAIDAAEKAFHSWKKQSAEFRSNLLRKWFDLMIENVDDLGKILTLEQGKPLAEAKGEVLYGASFVEWFAEEAKRIYGDVIPGNTENSRIVVLKQPIGVVGAITPWNFPNAMITRKVGPALAAGCTVVLKPPGLTPFSALALAKLAEKAGFPPGVFNIVTTTRSSVVGTELTSSKIVKKLSFTGSTEIGKLLMKQCADTVKKVSMELGGNAPFIVFNDANVEKAVQGAIASKYRNAGQTCVCTNRILVQSGIKEEFLKHYVKAVDNLKVGDGMQKNVEIGPLIDQGAIDKVEDLVKDALDNGASLMTGGNKYKQDSLYYQPTVICDVNSQMNIADEEIFGPVSTIFEFETEEEAIQIANDTPFGLASYFYGNNMSQIWRVAEALEYGMVGINTGKISTTVAPFGGIKESGIGREGSKYGIEEYMEIKYLNFEI
ncbi:MAG: NAD-dependent succinate-semialdehyde dehydrogenase [Bacteroidota bacterium]